MKKARILTISALLAIVVIALAERSFSERWRPASVDPLDTVYSMVNAARAGDVKAYLANFTEPMSTALKRSIAESTADRFADYLRQADREIKGVAASEPRQLDDGEVKVRIEYVYQDRNAVQILYLVRGGKGWRITRTEDDHQVAALVPYGTPVRSR